MIPPFDQVFDQFAADLKKLDKEAPIVVRAAHVALGMVVLQLVVASSMIVLRLPPVLRSLHEATGVGIWLSCFLLAYLARRTAPVASRAPVDAPSAIAAGIPPLRATES